MPQSTAIGPSSYSAILRRSFRKAFPPAVRGEGVYLWDARGKQYLDFCGSAAVNFIGHGVAEIAAAMASQAKQLEFVHSSQFTTPVAEEYAAELIDFAGKNFEGGCVYFTCGGSESVETALKLARQYQVEIGQTRRHQVISRGQSYHGSTLGALSVSGNKRRCEMYLPMVREFAHVAFPYCYRCAFDCTDGCRNCGQEYAAELEKAIEAAQGEVAAFIVEPVSGATLGAVVPPPGYLQSVAEICRRHGVLLIADEVMTGMGRTGRNFAVDHWESRRTFWSPPKDCRVAMRRWARSWFRRGWPTRLLMDREPFCTVSPTIRIRFRWPQAGRCCRLVQAAGIGADGGFWASNSTATMLQIETRTTCATQMQLAMFAGLDCYGVWSSSLIKRTKRPFSSESNFAGRVSQAAMKRGLLVYPMQGCVDGIAGDHLLIAPPAVITEEQIDWAVEQLREAIKKLFPDLWDEGARPSSPNPCDCDPDVRPTRYLPAFVRTDKHAPSSRRSAA